MTMDTNFITKQRAVLNGNHYYHFGIHPVTCCLYGNKEEEIVELQMKISDDQTIPENDANMETDYWGWFDNEKKDFTMIYPKRFLLNMCFPYGMDAQEKSGDGKAYRLELIQK